MGFLFNSPKVPTPPAPPPAANPPTFANPAVAMAGATAASRARGAAGQGFSDTIKNAGGPKGLVTKANNTAAKTLLG